MIDHPILSKDYTRRSLWGSCSPRSKGQGIKVLVEALRQLKFHLRRAQDLMTHYENARRKPTNYVLKLTKIANYFSHQLTKNVLSTLQSISRRGNVDSVHVYEKVLDLISLLPKLDSH